MVNSYDCSQLSIYNLKENEGTEEGELMNSIKYQ